MTTFQPNFIAYATAHNMTPEAILERDRIQWPGGCMVGFMLWIQERKSQFLKLYPEHNAFGNIANLEAWAKWLQDYAATCNTRKAATVGDCPKELRKRIAECVSVLRDDLRRLFRGAKFDFEKKRLTATSGHFVQWKLRPNPDAPESYENQQTNRGTCSFHFPDEA